MKRTIRSVVWATAIALTCQGVALAKPAVPKSWRGKVTKVADGDTVTVRRGTRSVRIRLHGIDCPEKAQRFGQAAKRFTARFALGKVATVEVVTIGKYGRTVAQIFVGGRSLNEALVKAGLAWWYRRYARRAKLLALLEAQARKAKRGLWADPRPVAPWTYRHRGKGYRGNVRSRVFHAAGCRHFRCKHCTAVFKTIRAARAARYRPHRACVLRR